MGRRRAENAARQLRSKHPDLATPLDVRALAKRLGIAVLERANLVKAGYGQLSALLLRREGVTLCVLNKGHAATRRRYSLAHEIGHYVLHPPEESFIDVAARSSLSSEGSDSKEIEANAFAAELLMPEMELREAVKSPLDASFEDEAEQVRILARRFRVSDLAMTYRLLNTGLLVEAPSGLGGL